MAVSALKDLYQDLPQQAAICAFNIYNMEFTQGVVEAAEKEDEPVILMISELALSFSDLETLVAICNSVASKSRIPVSILLDHGKSKEVIIRCIELGISVMFDGSHLPLEENIKQTRYYTELAHGGNVSIEAELGSLSGFEDGKGSESAFFTDPKEAKRFVNETGIDSLAVSIGNKHGFYRGRPNLDIERLKSINGKVEIPLVLHGGSDLPEEQIRLSIENGIRKLNIGTDVKYAFAMRLKSILNKDPMPFQPIDILGQAREAIVEEARKKIALTGSRAASASLKHSLR